MAAAWMGLALLSFAVLAVAVRQLLDTMDAFQILFLRSAIGLVLIVAYGFHRQPGFFRTHRLPMHLLRNLFHYGGQVFWIMAIGLLPLATVFALEFTTPIWAAILAAVVLRERLTPSRLLAIGFGFVGVMVILRPGYSPIGAGSAIALAAAVCFAVNVVATKALTRTDTPVTILFYMLLIQLVLGAAPAILTWAPLAWDDVPWVLAVAVTGLTAHLGMTKAFLYADAMVVAPMDFLRLPLIALVGFLVYGEPFDVLVLAGAALVFFGNSVNLRGESRRAA